MRVTDTVYNNLRRRGMQRHSQTGKQRQPRSEKTTNLLKKMLFMSSQTDKQTKNYLQIHE